MKTIALKKYTGKEVYVNPELIRSISLREVKSKTNKDGSIEFTKAPWFVDLVFSSDMVFSLPFKTIEEAGNFMAEFNITVEIPEEIKN